MDIKLYDHIIISREGKTNLSELELDEIEKKIKPKKQKIDKRKNKILER